jgi:hypothetical protein
MPNSERLPRNPLVPELNNHKNQFFKDKKKEKDKNKCRKKVPLPHEQR